MLTSREAAKLNSAIFVAFDKIGKHNGTAMPHSDKNTDAVAYELYVAQCLKRLCDARLKAATEQSISAGVMFDTSVKRLDAGASQTVYFGSVVQVGVTTKNASTTFDRKSAENNLKSLYPQHEAVISQVFNKATKWSAVPHTFTASLVIENGEA
jgi:hypothetical protein